MKNPLTGPQWLGNASLLKVKWLLALTAILSISRDEACDRSSRQIANSIYMRSANNVNVEIFLFFPYSS